MGTTQIQSAISIPGMKDVTVDVWVYKRRRPHAGQGVKKLMMLKGTAVVCGMVAATCASAPAPNPTKKSACHGGEVVVSIDRKCAKKLLDGAHKCLESRRCVTVNVLVDYGEQCVAERRLCGRG